VPLTGGPASDIEGTWLWRIFYPPIHGLAGAIFPMRVEGRANVPRSGAYIAVANHISWYDPPALTFALGLPLRYMAKREIFSLPVLGWVVRGIGNIPVRRGEGDRRAVATALAVLRAGHPLGFFPEGTRSRTRRLGRAKPGIAFLARRSGATILPVGLSGTPAGGPRIPPRRDIHVRIGAPFTLDDLGAGPEMDEQAVADGIMRRVADLLPDEMKGEYATLH
jgi:1-acyl-sn-glycerol-3-phosphate acyltransferase